MRPIKYQVALSDQQVLTLKKMIKNQSGSRTILKRAQVLLDADSKHGKQYTRTEIAKINHMSTPAMSTAVRLFATEGLESALTLKRNEASNHAAQKLTGEDQAKIIQLACSKAPEGYTRWTLSLLEAHCVELLDHPVKRDAIGRMLKKTNLNLTDSNTGHFPNITTPNL